MITRKSKIRYEIELTLAEFEEVKYKIANETSTICEMIYFNPKNTRYQIYFTKIQYKTFKRLRYETKNKK